MELKLDEVACSIGLNSSFTPATNITGPIGKHLCPRHDSICTICTYLVGHYKILVPLLFYVYSIYLFISEKSVPAGTKGNMYFYKVFCKGICNVDIKLTMDNDTHDTDLFAR